MYAKSTQWRRRLFVEVLRVEEKRRTRRGRGRVSFTQYLEFQEDQDMTKLFNFTRTQEMRREGVSTLKWRRKRVYIIMVEKNINKRLFNKG